MRQVVLDTETTGLSPQHGHRLTEIGCLEIIDRKITGRQFQSYLNPERELDDRAAEITGLSLKMLRDKPKFVQIVDEFIEFIAGAELIIHNAPFDVGFLDHELTLAKHALVSINAKFDVIDTLAMSREMFPGQKNNLDALCRRFAIDNSHRTRHGALLDAEILASVYLAMTAGQTNLDLTTQSLLTETVMLQNSTQQAQSKRNNNVKIIYPNEQELADHVAMLASIRKEKK